MNAMALNKLQPSVLVADQVFDAIHEAIMTGDLTAGRRLLIRDLAAELGTSVMPVREAIRRLEEAGLVEKEPYKGAVVKGLNLEELLQIYEVRRLLEVEAARLGTQRVTSEQVELMREHYQAMMAAIEEERVTDLLEHDEQLLATLYEAADNPVLLTSIRGLWRRCRPYKIVGARNTLESGDPRDLARFQEHLLEAAVQQDATTAAQVNDDSLLSATSRIRSALPQQKPAHPSVQRS